MYLPETFEAFLKGQQIGAGVLPAAVEAAWREDYEEAKRAEAKRDPHALFRLPCRTGEYRYAVAIDDGVDLWLTLVVQCSKSGYYVLIPRDTSPWDPHASYHAKGRYHHKSYDLTVSPPQQRQALNGFTGTEHLGSFYGHGEGIAICNSTAFTSVLTIPAGILEPKRGCVLVDLVAPDSGPAAHHREVEGLHVVREETYRDRTPGVVIAVAAQDDPQVAA